MGSQITGYFSQWPLTAEQHLHGLKTAQTHTHTHNNKEIDKHKKPCSCYC